MMARGRQNEPAKGNVAAVTSARFLCYYQPLVYDAYDVPS
jgi:hypothetical protein